MLEITQEGLVEKNGNVVENVQVSGKYANLSLDFTFKRAFGDRSKKKFIISLLNAILPDKKIEDIEFNITEKDGETAETKKFVLDLLCTSEDKTQFIVEMQNEEHKYFFQRCLAYASRIYAEKAVKGNRYNQYLPVYLIAILSGNATHKGMLHKAKYNNKFLYHYLMAEKETHEVPVDGISIIFVELEKFRKEEKDCSSMMDWWFYIIKNSESMTAPPSDDVFEHSREFFELLEISKFTPMENRAYIHEYFAEQDKISARETAISCGREEGLAKGLKEGLKEGLAKGLEEGLVKGLAEGAANEQLRIAKELKAKGIPVETIAECTGLSVENVRNL